MYAAVSRNLAFGFGDFWHPAFSPKNGAAFYEHPPLAFLLESYGFRIFGDHFWVEKLYSALTAIATIGILIALWRQLTGPQSSLAAHAWLPILLWAMFKHWSWQYGNNYLENTVCIFAPLAVYAVLRANTDSRTLSGWILLAALCTLGAVLSKGPVGLFPLVTPLVAGCTLQPNSWTRAWLSFVALLVLFCAMFALVLLQPDAREFFSRYLQHQVIASLLGLREKAPAWGHFYILKVMKNDLRFPAALALAFVLIDYLRNRARPLSFSGDAQSKSALRFCLATAVTASFPIMLSPKQWSFYTYPSYPFYSLTLAIWCAPAVARLLNAPKLSAAKWAHPAFRALTICALLAVGGVSWRRMGIPQSDPEMLHDAVLLSQLMPSQMVVSVSSGLARDWRLQAYLSRWANVGVDSDHHENEYFLACLDEPQQVPSGYVALPSDMLQYRLYRRCDPTANNADKAQRGQHEIGSIPMLKLHYCFPHEGSGLGKSAGEQAAE